MSLLVRTKLHCLRPSLRLLHLNLSISTPFLSSIYRLLNTTTNTTAAQALHTNPVFAVEYLMQSCGISRDKAIHASKSIQHLKSPDKPDAVLRFLRQIGVSELDIRTAVSRDSRILCYKVEKTLMPNIKKLQELGFSTEDISATISRRPHLLGSNIAPKVDFLMRALGSIDNVSFIIMRRGHLLSSSLEKVLMPNLSFLREQCNLSACQIILLIKRSSCRLISSKPETLKIYAKSAEELQVPMSSPKFVRALVVVSKHTPNTLDAKKHHMERLGLSKEEVSKIISKEPLVLQPSRESLTRKLKFLMNEAAFDKTVVVQNPKLLTLSLEKRLVPRSLIWKLLVSKGLRSANGSFLYFLNLSDKIFTEKVVLPHQHAIPGLPQAYADVCAGKTGAFDFFRSI